MSVQTTVRETFECARCGGPRQKRTSVKGSFCSLGCYYAHKGAKALNTIREDHKTCSSCFRPVKTVYRPDDSECYQLRKKPLIIREAFVGFETDTQYADRGMWGIECKCGTVNQSDEDEMCRDGVAYEWFLWQHFQASQELDATFDIATFADLMWEHNDLERAVGEALYA